MIGLPSSPLLAAAQRHAGKWLAGGLGGMLLLIAVTALANPAFAAKGYGIASADPAALAYMRAAGLRDGSVALAVFLLLLAGEARALRWVLLATAVIPVGDAAIVLSSAGFCLPVCIHACGLAYVLAAWWALGWVNRY